MVLGRRGFPLIGTVFHAPQSVCIRCKGELDSMRYAVSTKKFTLPREHNATVTGVLSCPGFPGGSVVNNPLGGVCSIPGSGRSPGKKKKMTIHSSILAGKIPWTEEPGGLQSMGPQRVGKDSAST